MDILQDSRYCSGRPTSTSARAVLELCPSTRCAVASGARGTWLPFRDGRFRNWAAVSSASLSLFHSPANHLLHTTHYAPRIPHHPPPTCSPSCSASCSAALVQCSVVEAHHAPSAWLLVRVTQQHQTNQQNPVFWGPSCRHAGRVPDLGGVLLGRSRNASWPGWRGPGRRPGSSQCRLGAPSSKYLSVQVHVHSSHSTYSLGGTEQGREIEVHPPSVALPKVHLNLSVASEGWDGRGTGRGTGTGTGFAAPYLSSAACSSATPSPIPHWGPSRPLL